MTYWSRKSKISLGLGSSSHLSSELSESSSSMISLQRSMHSSQMYTPGPAMSFFTCFWLLPQKEHFSRSPPSPMRATGTPPHLFMWRPSAAATAPAPPSALDHRRLRNYPSGAGFGAGTRGSVEAGPLGGGGAPRT